MDIENQLASISLKAEDTNTGSSSAPRANLQASVGSDSDGNEGRDRFFKYVTEGRKLAEEGDIAGAIKLNEKALAIKFSEKLHKRIEKMEAFLAAQEEEDEEEDNEGNGDMRSLGQGFMLHHNLHAKLYQHQKQGVLWMWSLFCLGKGGILADDMGLGKTIQVIAFLAGMFDMDKIKTVLIVVPLSLIPNWVNEFNKWTPGINVMQFHGTSKKERDRALLRVRSRGGVLMTTYGLVVTTHETLSKHHGSRFVWDCVILDEGHKIKNPTKTSKSINSVPARLRMILTGTPVQNNLKELWSLFDYVHQGTLLGTMRTFKLEFETPIIRARERDATAVAKRLGQEMAETLKGIIKPYFLRRTKAEVSAAASIDDSDSIKMPTMTRKNDLVIWMHLTEAQQRIYQDFLNLDSVKQLLMTKKSPLVALTVLKKICDSPRLLSKRACMQLGLDGDDYTVEDLERPDAYESAAIQINTIPDEVLVNEAGKMQILVQLLDQFKSEGRKTLVFSQSSRMLDIVQKVITNMGHKCARLDGKVTQLAERDQIVKKFQRDASYTVFLLTVQVGGVGLTITSADRVVIYDPNWNPATDAQAVDRAYRIGQQKNVVVYRLITCGTVEEKIYRRQVFKDSITRQTTGGSTNPYRYFTSIELRELFTLDDPKFSKTQRQLEEMHSGQRNTDTALDEHIAFLHSLDIFGISDHDLMFQQTEEGRDDEEPNEFVGEEETHRDRQFIDLKIRQAQTLIAGESENPFAEYEDRSKGGMRYPFKSRPPPTTSGADNVPGPSLLFSHIPTGATVEVSDSEDEDQTNKIQFTSDTHSESGSNSARESSFEGIDLTQMVDDDKDDLSNRQQIKALEDVLSPPKKLHKPSVKSPGPKHIGGQHGERRALQPLGPDEIKMRSPVVVASGRKGPLVNEEIMISPDVSSPVVGLEKVDLRRKLLEEEEEERRANGSLPSSPHRPQIGSPRSTPHYPVQRISNKKLFPASPSKQMSEAKSPNRGYQSPHGKRLVALAASNHSTPAISTSKTNKILAAGTPQSDEDILMSPELDAEKDISVNRSVEASPNVSHDYVDLSPARRKLSFVIPDSPETASANQSMLDQSLTSASNTEVTPHALRKLSSIISISSPSSGNNKQNISSKSSVRPGVNDGGDRKMLSVMNSPRATGLCPPILAGVASPVKLSPASLLLSPGARVNKKNKRRSVCVQSQQKQLDECFEDEDLGNNKSTGSHSSSDEADNKENDCVEDKDVHDENDDDGEKESGSLDEEDKENDGVRIKQGGGRNRIISESGSSDGSCFEVPISDDDEGHDSDRSREEPAAITSEEEEPEMTEEDTQRFQELVFTSRQLYKKKNFEDSLMFIEQALTICQDPGLMEMADKIRFRIAEFQS